MKKLLTTALAALIVVSVKAQNEFVSRFGVKAGLGMSTLTNTDDAKWKLSWKAGIAGDFEFLPFLSLQPSLFYSSKGYERNMSNNAVGFTVNATAGYVELPVMIMFKIPLTKAIKLNAGVGPYFAYGVAGKTKLSGDVIGVGGDTDWNTFDGSNEIFGTRIFPAMERFDWGLSAAVSFQISPFVISVNYDIGLKDVYNGNTLSGSNDESSRLNSNLWLSVAFLF